MRVFPAILALSVAGCLNVQEVDRRTGKNLTALHVSGNFEHLQFKSANGSTLIVDGFEPDKTHAAISSGISKGILAGGTAFGPIVTKLLK